MEKEAGIETEVEIEEKESAASPMRTTLVLRLAAGGYLVYLAVGLLQEYLEPVQIGGGRIFQLGSAVVFGAAGVCLSGWALKKLIHNS